MKIKSSILILVVLMLTFYSCKEEQFAIPPYEIPYFDEDGKEILTIEEFKNKYMPTGTSYIALINDDVYVKGVVTANDKTGNIYKTMYIQDSTGGLKVPLDSYTISSLYPVGQTVYLKCKGSYAGLSYGIPQFGGDNDGKPGRIVSDKPDTIVIRHLSPSLSNVPEIKEFTGCAQIPDSYLNCLVKVNRVFFELQGQGATFGSDSVAYPEKVIKDGLSSNILSISNYATFAKDTLPTGYINITAILGDYGTVNTNRLIIRDLDDIEPYE